MSIYDEANETEQKVKKNMSYMANAAKEASSGAHDIKENVVGLARNVRDASSDKAQALSDYLRSRMSDLKASGENSLERLEVRVRSKPGQSIAIAFTAGLLASYLLGRRAS